MSDKPIIFTGEMVRAILDGRKTQTRRVMKPQPLILDSGGAWYPDAQSKRAKHYASDAPLRKGLGCDFPLYRPGDRLWVRETWGFHVTSIGSKRYEEGPFVYRADCMDETPLLGGKWRPSIFMPRWASRITLEVTEVRAQRIQDISEEDARAEGMPTLANLLCLADPPNAEPMRRESFNALWNTIHRKHPDHQWQANPWVWAYTFRRIEP